MLLEPQILSQNDTNKTVVLNARGINCAKECPCGVPVIPVPDQWLEVMVTGGFKVWHIIFIIIAFIVTMTVVYCCFHRCRIPRTKQEIEADLMRSNLTDRFRNYLQELPNEPTTFIDALKRVQDIEEKLEQDGSRELGARKRKVWGLKGYKGKEDKEPSTNDPVKDKDKEKDKETKENKDNNNNNNNSNNTVGNGTINTTLQLDETKPKTQPISIEIPPDIMPVDTLPLPADKNALNVPKFDSENPLISQKIELENSKVINGKAEAPSGRSRKRRKPNLSRTKRARDSDLEQASPPVVVGPLTQAQDTSKQTTPPIPMQESTPAPTPPQVDKQSHVAVNEKPAKAKTKRTAPSTQVKEVLAHEHKELKDTQQPDRPIRSRERRKKIPTMKLLKSDAADQRNESLVT